MCGRFEFNLSDPYMQSVFKDLQGRHNYELLHSGEIFPTDSVPALVMKNGDEKRSGCLRNSHLGLRKI